MNEKFPKVVSLDDYRDKEVALYELLKDENWSLSECADFSHWILVQAAWYQFSNPEEIRALRGVDI